MAASAIEFADSVTVNDTVIRLGDIVRVSGAEKSEDLRRLAQMPIGEAAPPSYSRFVNVQEVMRSLAREGVTASSLRVRPPDRITVKTDYEEKSVDDFKPDIEAFIGKNINWPAGDYSIRLLNPREKIALFKAPHALRIQGLPSKYPRDGFTLNLIISQKNRTYVLHAQCSMTVITSVVVAGGEIFRNAVCDEKKCILEKRDITHYKYIPYCKVSDACGKRAARTISPGTILNEKMLEQIPDVCRDQEVQLVVASGNVKVSLTARARESGTIGDHIWVENEMTHKLLKATVTAAGKTTLSQGEKL